MYAQTILIGRLTKDPETKQLTINGEQQTVTNFSVATDAGNNNADYHNVVAWRKLGETCARNLTKGRLVSVVGKPKTRSYEQDGRRVYVHEVIADNVTFLDSKNSGQQGGAPAQPQNSGYTNQNQAPYQPTNAPTGFPPQGQPFGAPVEINNDDLPF